jgi:sugar lactone lactonase YvrE
MSILSGGVDYTGDGFADLIARDAAGVLWIYPWNGSACTARVKIGNGWNGHRLIH